MSKTVIDFSLPPLSAERQALLDMLKPLNGLDVLLVDGTQWLTMNRRGEMQVGDRLATVRCNHGENFTFSPRHKVNIDLTQKPIRVMVVNRQ